MSFNNNNNKRVVNLEERLTAVQNKFGVSKECASYLYYRSFYSKKRDGRYLPWGVKLQNALVKADRCIGLEWEKLIFGNEEEQLLEYGINVEDMSDAVFSFVDEPSHTDNDTDTDGPEWQVVKSSSRRKKYKNLKNKEKYLITYSGLIYE